MLNLKEEAVHLIENKEVFCILLDILDVYHFYFSSSIFDAFQISNFKFLNTDTRIVAFIFSHFNFAHGPWHWNSDT